MTTNILIKTDSKLRDEAKKVAEDLGLSLTSAVNAFLKQFVRDQRIVLEAYPTPKASKLRQWARDSKDMDEHPEKYIRQTADEFIEELRRL